MRDICTTLIAHRVLIRPRHLQSMVETLDRLGGKASFADVISMLDGFVCDTCIIYARDTNIKHKIADNQPSMGIVRSASLSE